MTGYEHEKEQIDAIRKWWEQNGKAIVVGAVLGITALVGWQTWSQYQRSVAESASAEFAQLLTELERNDAAAVGQRGQHIVGQLGGSVYADAAALALARTSLDAGDSAAAKTHLQRVIDDPQLPEIGHVARLRLARVLFDEQSYEEALKTLEVTVPEAYVSSYEELKGDVYMARGDRELARTAYEKAQAQADPGQSHQQIQMKLDELGVMESR